MGGIGYTIDFGSVNTWNSNGSPVAELTLDDRGYQIYQGGVYRTKASAVFGDFSFNETSYIIDGVESRYGNFLTHKWGDHSSSREPVFSIGVGVVLDVYKNSQ